MLESTKTLGVLFLLIAASASAQVSVGNFECQSPGAMMTATADCEGWTNVGGQQGVLPDGTIVTSPCILPTTGSKWAEISSINTGPASPTVAPSSPGTWPFNVGSVSEMQLTVNVPSFASGLTGIAVDWHFTTDEGTSGSGIGADDFAQIVVVNANTMQVVRTLLFVDTYPPNNLVVNTCPSFLNGFAHFNGTSGLGSASVILPTSIIGQPVIISVVCANQLDGVVSSSLFIDNLRFFDPSSVFGLLAATSGNCTGDLTYFIGAAPVPSTNVLVLISGTPAPNGVGSGPAFGLVPDALFLATLFTPSAPGSILHYPVGASPFAGGPLQLPPGAASGLCGQTWDVVAVAYNLAQGVLGVTNIDRLAW